MDARENEVMTFDQEEIRTGLCAVKDWLSNTLYEGVQVLREHKKAVLTAAAIVVTAAGVVGGLWALLTKKK